MSVFLFYKFMIIKNSNFSAMSYEIKNKNVFIYGAGMIGKIIMPYIIQEYNLYECIKGFIDKKKYGEKIKVRFKEYEVYSPEILHCIDDSSVILITNSVFYEVVEYLDKIENLRNVEVYIFPIIKLEECEISSSIKVGKLTENPIIPKKIHYCWFSKKPIPNFLQNCIESWKKMCPDYEIICWNEDNYDIDKYLYTREAYRNQKYGFVSDMARLDILYENGGIYLDTDVTILKCLDELLYQEAFIGVEKWGNINSGGGFGAIPHHPMVKKMLEDRINLFSKLETGLFETETNGFYETNSFIELGMKPDNSMQLVNGVTVYPYDIFHPYDYVSCNTMLSENTFSVHHFYGGWMEKDSYDYRSITQKKYRDIENRIQKGKSI